MVNWRLAYRGLARAGFTDKQIGALAQVSRNTVNRVRNGTYTHKTHNPGYEGGKRVLDTIAECVRQGILDHDPMLEANDGIATADDRL